MPLMSRSVREGRREMCSRDDMDSKLFCMRKVWRCGSRVRPLPIDARVQDARERDWRKHETE